MVPNIISKDAKGTNKYKRDVGGTIIKNILYFIFYIILNTIKRTSRNIRKAHFVCWV
jgi:hypothetical protein